MELRKGNLLKEEDNKNGFLDMFEDNEFLPEKDDKFDERKYQGRGE